MRPLCWDSYAETDWRWVGQGGCVVSLEIEDDDEDEDDYAGGRK